MRRTQSPARDGCRIAGITRGSPFAAVGPASGTVHMEDRRRPTMVARRVGLWLAVSSILRAFAEMLPGIDAHLSPRIDAAQHLTPLPTHRGSVGGVQHPASAAEEAFYRQRVTFNAARRLEQLQSTSRRVSVRRAKELEVGAYFVRNRVEAAQKLQRYAEKAYLMSPRFNDPYPPLTNIGAPAAGGETPHHSNNNEAQPLVLQRARGPHPGASPSPRPSPRSPRKRTSARGKAGREEAALTSAQTVLAVMDVLYAKLEAEDIAAQRMRFGQGDEPLHARHLLRGHSKRMAPYSGVAY